MFSYQLSPRPHVVQREAGHTIDYSNLATVTVAVAAAPPCTIASSASAPATATVGVAVSFTASATALNCQGAVAYDWDFGDGSAHASTENPTHGYATAGTFTWRMTASASGVTSSQSGSIAVAALPSLTITSATQMSDPFRIRIDGSGFQQGVKVYIGTSTTAWLDTQLVSGTRLLLGGRRLSREFPRGRAVAIRVVNPNGQSASTTFTRR